MLNYDETQQKIILREMEKDLMTLVAVDMMTGEYEVIYSDGAYKNYENRYHRDNFFEAWITIGIPFVFEPDRFRMSYEISKEHLTTQLEKSDSFNTICQFIINDEPKYCRIKVAKDILETGNIVISIRNIDQELRHDLDRLAQVEELHRKEKVYREAILANSAGYMEVNLSKNQITTKIYDNREEWMPKEIVIPELGDPVPYDAFEQWWAENMLLSDQQEFLEFSNCDHLIECFENDQRVVSIECKAKTASGGVSVCLETYYISQDEVSKDILAICVLYDLTQKQKREQDLQQMEEKLNQMRMKNFISQMHPHFLYNALGSIREIVLTDPEYGADMLYDFTTHLRASIRAMSNDDKIWFSQELENIKAYVSIEKMRFGDKLNVVYDIDTVDFQIIPLGIQPIVENAIKHGLYEKSKEGGTVYLKTWESDTSWEISIEDNGVGFNPEAIQNEITGGKRDSTGLYNLVFRLENMMNAVVDINSKEGHGTIVHIHIPKEKK